MSLMSLIWAFGVSYHCSLFIFNRYFTNMHQGLICVIFLIHRNSSVIVKNCPQCTLAAAYHQQRSIWQTIKALRKNQAKEIAFCWPLFQECGWTSIQSRVLDSQTWKEETWKAQPDLYRCVEARYRTSGIGLSNSYGGQKAIEVQHSSRNTTRHNQPNLTNNSVSSILLCKFIKRNLSSNISSKYSQVRKWRFIKVCWQKLLLCCQSTYDNHLIGINHNIKGHH